jgi:alpha-tubulin suppressor-like RCC1 family protein
MPGSETLGVCELSAGRNFSMLLTLEGEVYSWGDPTDGRLGHGDEAEQLSPTLIQAFEGMKVIKIASGLLYSLALTDDGSTSNFVIICNSHTV